jgi:2-polyprenyl-6-methoxyphenol hydroxylase-like FAD-dependent oxidoreductase
MMTTSRQEALPLIAGAGPVGLAAALFLARAGVRVRLIERRAQPSIESRALAVNPRTLELLESTGVTAKMLERGGPMRGGRFRFGKSHVGEISFEGIHPRFPFMLALSQAATEKLLEEALVAAGGRVERNVELVTCRNAGGRVEAELRGIGSAEGSSAGSGSTEHYTCPCLLAADGAHSRAREAMGLAFEGTSVEREWYLADLPLNTPLDDERAQVWFLDGGGFVFCIRVIADQHAAQPSAPLWRVIANLPDPISLLSDAEPAGEPVWESSFRVAHRMAERMQKGRVYLAGDAAHVHSPIGARGMNLGIEDAWVFSHLVARGEMDRYDGLRRPVDAKVVRNIRRLTWIARGESALPRFFRSHIAPHLLEILGVRARAMRIATGLDHEVGIGP